MWEKVRRHHSGLPRAGGFAVGTSMGGCGAPIFSVCGDEERLVAREGLRN